MEILFRLTVGQVKELRPLFHEAAKDANEGKVGAVVMIQPLVTDQGAVASAVVLPWDVAKAVQLVIEHSGCMKDVEEAFERGYDDFSI